MKKKDLIPIIAQHNPLLAMRSAEWLTTSKTDGQHRTPQKNRRMRSMPTSAPSMRTVTAR